LLLMYKEVVCFRVVTCALLIDQINVDAHVL